MKTIIKVINKICNYKFDASTLLTSFFIVFASVIGFLYINAHLQIKKEDLLRDEFSDKLDPNLSLRGLSLYIGDDEVYRFIGVSGGRIVIQDSVNRVLTVNSFLLGEIPVTTRLYYYVMDDYNVTDDKAFEKYYDVAVDGKTKEEWIAFLNKLNQKTGHNFRMPTIDEWIYAARGGITNCSYKYSGSDSIDKVAVYSRTRKPDFPLMCRQKNPNVLGIYDMSGLVEELTSTPNLTYYPKLRVFKDKLPQEVIDGNLSIGGFERSNAEACSILNEPGFGVHTGTRLVLVE